MGRQIIKQPNGLYAEFSSITDSFIIWDATKEQLLQHRIEEAIEDAKYNFKRTFERVESCGKPYYQFTLTWEEAVEEHNKNSEQKI